MTRTTSNDANNTPKEKKNQETPIVVKAKLRYSSHQYIIVSKQLVLSHNPLIIVQSNACFFSGISMLLTVTLKAHDIESMLHLFTRR